MTQKVRTTGKGDVNGLQSSTEAFIGVGNDYAKSFQVKDVSGISIDGVNLGIPEKLTNGK